MPRPRVFFELAVGRCDLFVWQAQRGLSDSRFSTGASSTTCGSERSNLNCRTTWCAEGARLPPGSRKTSKLSRSPASADGLLLVPVLLSDVGFRNTVRLGRDQFDDHDSNTVRSSVEDGLPRKPTRVCAQTYLRNASYLGALSAVRLRSTSTAGDNSLLSKALMAARSTSLTASPVTGRSNLYFAHSLASGA